MPPVTDEARQANQPRFQPKQDVYDQPGHAPSKPGVQDGDNDDGQSSSPDLAGDEEEADDDQSTDPDRDESNAVQQQTKKSKSGRDFSDAPSKPGRGPAPKIGAGFIVGLVFSTLIIGFQYGPDFAIQHIREMLTGSLSRIQTSHQLRYRRTRINRVRDLFSRDGRRGGRIISQMERKGFTFAFEGRSNNIVGLRPPGSNTFLEGDDIGFAINKYLTEKSPLPNGRLKTARMEAFFTRYRVSRRTVIARSPDADEDAVVEMRRRLASQVVPEEPDTRATAPQAGDDRNGDGTADFDGDFDSRSGENRAIAESDGSFNELRQKILNGENLTAEELAVIQSSNRVDNEILQALYNIAPTSSLAGRAWNTIKGFASATDIADKVCTMKNRLRAIESAARLYRALSLLRYASIFIAASDELRKGDLQEVDPALLGELFSRITALDSNGQPLGAAPGFSYMMNGRYSKSKNDAYKENIAVDGSLSGLPGAIDQGLEFLPGASRGQCAVWQNPGFQIGVGVIEVGIAIFTGGGSEAGIQAGKQSAVQAIRLAIRNIITKRTAIQLAESVAIDLTFEGALLLLQVYAEKATSLNFTGRERGAELGSILVAGGGVSNKQRSLQAGQTPATTTQYSRALDALAAEERELDKRKSFFARTFDYQDYDSLTFKAASKFATIPFSMEGVGLGLHNGLNGVASLLAKPLSMLSGVSTLLLDKVGAQPADDDEVRFGEYEVEGGDYDGEKLATDPAGNLLTIMKAEVARIDPEENITILSNSGDIDANTLLPTSDDFNSYIENCVEAVETLTAIENNQSDCLATRSITIRYVAHLAYIDMIDGIDAILFPNEIPEGGLTP